MFNVDIVKAETLTTIAQSLSTGTSALVLQTIHPSESVSFYSARGTTCVATDSGYVLNLTIQVKASVSYYGVLRANIFSMNETSITSGHLYEEFIVATSTNTANVSVANGYSSSVFQNVTFNFDGTYLIETNDVFAWSVEIEESNGAGSTILSLFYTTNTYGGASAGFFNGNWGDVVTSQDFYFILTGIDTIQPTATPIEENPDGIMPIVTGINTFLFGDTGTLGAGFGLIVMLAVTFIFFAFGGKSLIVLLLAVNVATFINLAVGIWELWTLIVIIIIDVAIALKSSGVIGGGGGGGEM